MSNYGNSTHLQPSSYDDLGEDILEIAKPGTNGQDGDWNRVYTLIQNNSRGYEYLMKQNELPSSTSPRNQQNYANCNDGKTLLHYACTRAKRKDAEEAATKIFEWCTNNRWKLESQKLIDFVNLEDGEGNTALQLATDRRNKPLVKLLIENRADIYKLKLNNDLHLETIHMIYDKVLINIFDQSVTIGKAADDQENESLWEIGCDFSPITGLHNSNLSNSAEKPLNQTLHLARVLRRETATRAIILQHPLVQIFLHFKGEKFAWILYTSMLYHIVWSLISFVFIFCNTHILDSTNIENTSRESNLTVLCQPFRIYQPGQIKFHTSAYFYIMLILYVMSVGKEVAELTTCPEKWYYWKQLENLGQWVVNVTIFVVWLVTLITGLENIDEGEETFLKENGFLWTILLPGIYIFGILSSFLLIQGQLTKTEFLGIYNEMFANGFWNIIKFILAFLPLLIAFLITFHLLLPMKREFLPSWGLSFAKIISMMTGEINYDDVFYGEDEEDIAFKNILKVLFIVFVVTVVILLQNLLIGMTVSDVQKLEERAKVNNLASRLEDIYLLENLVTNPWIVTISKWVGLDQWLRETLTVGDVDIDRNKNTSNNKTRLDEYPADIRDVIILWDKNQSETNNNNHVVMIDEESFI